MEKEKNDLSGNWSSVSQAEDLSTRLQKYLASNDLKSILISHPIKSERSLVR